ncbi:MAG: hypothetical protein IKR43_05850 [Lachnospiraceae bacterium]|nr:hypothetical protein [Lachnospiraceae bacterium]
MRPEKEESVPGGKTRRRIRAAICLAVLMTVMTVIFLLRGKNAGEETSEENAPEEITSGEGMIAETPEERTAEAGTGAAAETPEEERTAEEAESSAAAKTSEGTEASCSDEMPEEPGTDGTSAEAGDPGAASSFPAVSSAPAGTAAGTEPSAAPSFPPGSSASSAPAASSAAPSSAAPVTSAAEPPPHRHSYRGTVTQEATCGAAGVMTYVCACGASYTEAVPATGRHDWTPVTAVIHHDAEIHTVHHDEQRHRIVDVPAYDEYVYELHAVCSGCGMDLTLLERENGTTPAEHSWQHYEKEGVGYGWHDEQVVVGSVHHDEQSHEEVIPAWDETVVDREAWDETVISAYRCAVCGAVKD